ncbi:class I lanthipeptide [Zunongwangia sp. F363]|uniref:Class I lanthipeptide n=1 Tax=Autumnicola tepida TaxID=3075595 RepID=A0ABU3C5H6_9FLAO|nr:class I lanthipeptide [Zunongwangia sp. F363]MDT0641583.1 class I lanthipeptide [Zunongwangia sp. F363]
MNKKFSKLQFSKKTIAKLNEDQLSSVKGGNNARSKSVDTEVETGCSGTSTTKNCSTTSTTNIE